MSNELSKSEARELADCENVIREGLSTFREVGERLARIRDKRLYRVEFKTFEGYCKSRFGFTRQRASQLILAAQPQEDCQPAVDSPANERQARKQRASRKAKSADEHEATDYYEDQSPVEAADVTYRDTSPDSDAEEGRSGGGFPGCNLSDDETRSAQKFRQRLIDWTRMQFDNIDGLNWQLAACVFLQLSDDCVSWN